MTARTRQSCDLGMSSPSGSARCRGSCRATERYLVGPGTRKARSRYVGRTGFEPVTSSVSGNDICRICFRFFAVNCCLWSTLVRWCPLLSAAIVTQLVTRLRARGQTDPLFVGSVCAAGQPTSSPVRRRLAVRECLSTRRRFQAEAGNCPLRRARAPGRQRRSALVRATERYPRGLARRVRLAP